jgi:hypothetical protein
MMKIEKAAISSLMMDPTNERGHSETNIQAIMKSLEAFGQRKPIVVWNEMVIAGNGTLDAATRLGWKDIHIVRAPDDWSMDQAKAFAIADNRTAELAEWDGRQLLMTLEGLPEDLLEATGFNADEMADLDKIWGGPPDLDDLHNEIGDPTDEDGLILVRFKIPPDVHEKWQAALVATGQQDMEAIALAIQAAFDALTDGSM